MNDEIFGEIVYEVKGMDIANLRMCHKQRTDLNLSPEDLNESDDPLENILLDVMFDSFYQRTINRSKMNQNRFHELSESSREK
jgi:hypothetical protein